MTYKQRLWLVSAVVMIGFSVIVLVFDTDYPHIAIGGMAAFLIYSNFRAATNVPDNE